MTTGNPLQNRTIQERFNDFHGQRPEVFQLFCELAHQVRNAGFQRYSAHAIIYHIRWSNDVRHGPNDTFKINDHFASRYARLLIQYDPTFRDFFACRRLRAA